VTATISNDGIVIETEYLQNCLKLLVPRDELTLREVQQFYVKMECEEWNFDALIDLYQSVAIERNIIFVNTKEKGNG
jgi:superfamily II DNA/RNA helicase